MMNDEIRDLAHNIGVGRFVCPSCGGGSGKEKSLAIWRQGARYKALCYRNTCSLGFVTGTMDGSRMSMTKDIGARKFKKKECYTGEALPMSTAASVIVNDSWNVPSFTPTFRWTETGDVLVPILDSAGQRRGDHVRQLKPYEESRPKGLSYYEEGYSGLAWFKPSKLDVTPCVVLVEDVVSAMVLAEHGIIGVALLGTGVNYTRLKEVIDYGVKTVHIALDADAMSTAVGHRRKFNSLVDIRVHLLFHDIKDMDEEELGNFLAGLSV